VSDYFFDSSALLKRYMNEQGSARVLALTARRARNTIFIAQITPVEVISGVARQHRTGQLPAAGVQRARRLFDRHIWHEYKIVALTDAIVAHAKDLVGVYPLRAYDAVQLASASEANARLLAARSPPLTFVSADTRLLAAAAAEGLATEDPNAYR
jgi:predicted nucleic acid-binding protein